VPLQGVLKRDEGRIDEAISAYEACLAIDPLSRNAGQNRLLALNSIGRSHESMVDTMEHVWQAHRDWGTTFANHVAHERYTTWSNTKHLSRTLAHPLPSRPLRIGYISADFFTHSVSYFIEAPLKYADPTRTFVVCYANVARRDKKTQLLESYAHAWRAIHDKSAKEVCELIRADGIDILIELTGHTAGNRLDVMALKPAPIQVTWIGYPNTTGLPTVDYRFCDAIVDPVDTQQKYSETLVRLSGPFLCYTPPAEAPAVSDSPALHRGYVTFGSFNNLAKINEDVLNAWCMILNQVPNSRMLIKCKPFASATVAGKMLQRFADRGIDASRVDLVPLLPTTSEHLATYAGVDISVDTFPYAGTTTTCESLYMGTPVVTYKRETCNNHAHNVGASLISRIPGAELLIARSIQQVQSTHTSDPRAVGCVSDAHLSLRCRWSLPLQYVSTAVSLASNLPRLQQLRQHLRPAMLQSPLCDGPCSSSGEYGVCPHE
jgi:protein O-GlcNAc transferase